MKNTKQNTKQIRSKLSPKSLKLPSAYRTTAWAEIQLPPQDGRNNVAEIARFHSRTPGHVEVFALQDGNGGATEISQTLFQILIVDDLKNKP